MFENLSISFGATTEDSWAALVNEISVLVCFLCNIYVGDTLKKQIEHQVFSLLRNSNYINKYYNQEIKTESMGTQLFWTISLYI